ncbi:MAG: radical SAM protein [Candidatus Heimdallarchaeota archaeon]
MKLLRLEFTLTTRCNSQCIHCQADASPSRNEVMSVEDAFNYLTEATAISKLDSFMIFGGEPMLYPKRTIAIIKKGHQLRIPKIEMITNGIWGKNKETAEKLAMKLKTAGLNTINISIDAFHLRYIPIKYPQNAALASLKAGINNIVYNVAVIDSINAQNEFDKKTAQVLKKLEPKRIDVRIVNIVPVGRALQNLSQNFQQTSLNGPCEGEAITGNTLTDPESICIEPSGSANICWNLPIGNAQSISLRRLITEYKWKRNSITKILVEEGPTGLLKLPEARSVQFQEKQYINKCHFCIAIRKALRPFYQTIYS